MSFFEVLNALTRQALGEIDQSMETLTAESRVVQELQQLRLDAQARAAALEKPKNNLCELHSVCLIQRRWAASASKRKLRNVQARREAIRLRQTGTLVPESFHGRIQHSSIFWKGRLFIFGGRGETEMLRDFWEVSLNAGNWLDQSHTVPLRMKARCGHTALLQGSRMVVVGGHTGEGFLNDVWECELNGLYWRQVGFSLADRKEQLARQIASSATTSIEVASGITSSSNASDATPRLGDGSTGNSGDAPPIAFAPILPGGRRTKVSLAAHAMRAEAAIVLQRHVRGLFARVIGAWLRAAAYLEYDAATYIQAIWKGLVTRRLLRAPSPPAPSAANASCSMHDQFDAPDGARVARARSARGAAAAVAQSVERQPER